MSKLENSSLSSGQIWRQVADPRGSISQRLPRFTPNQNQGASTPYRHFPSRKNILRNKKNILRNNKIFYGIKNICTHSVVVGVGSVVRGRGGAGSAAGAGEVDGAVGGVLCLHLRPAPHLHAVSALPVRISLRDAVRLILKNINSVYFFNVFSKIISILQCPVSSSLITYQVNRRIYPSHHASYCFMSTMYW